MGAVVQEILRLTSVTGACPGNRVRVFSADVHSARRLETCTFLNLFAMGIYSPQHPHYPQESLIHS
jgi:hypothetical protein